MAVSSLIGLMNGRGLRRFAGLTILWFSLAASIGAAAQDKSSDKISIRIAVEGAYPPFNYVDQNNELQGFEIDLLKALCEAMQAQCTPVQHDWDGIIRGLINREYDAIMSSLEITDRRKKRIAFSRHYYRMPAGFIAAKDTGFAKTTPKALAGKRVGTAERSEHAAYLEGLYHDSDIRLYGKLEDANLDLLTGRLDLVLGDKLALTSFLDSREGACCQFVGDVPMNLTYYGQGYGVGLRKEDEDLKGRFDRAIDQVIADGTYDRIRARYFPFDIK